MLPNTGHFVNQSSLALRDRMDMFFRSNPGMASRIAHHIDFPDYSAGELYAITEIMAQRMNYRLDAAGMQAMQEYIARRMTQPRFSNARSIRNGLDRARLRMANRLFAERGRLLTRADLETITAADIRASRVFQQ
jgi:hypothetical protein